MIVLDATTSVLVHVCDVNLIENLPNVLQKEGFREMKCRYADGMWVWIEFVSQESCRKFQASKEVKWYFTSLASITNYFLLKERMIWLEIEGLSICMWTTSSFKKIASDWGEIVFLDDD